MIKPSRNRADASVLSRDEVVCACADLHRHELEAMIAKNPEISFDDILARTGAGGTCTACLLDLEYHFVSLPRARPAPGAAETGFTRRKDTRSLKRRLFDFLDGISPPVRYRLEERMPVILGEGIEQRVWIVNRSLMFEGEVTAPQMEVIFRIRDAEGRSIHRSVERLEPEGQIEFMPSRYLSPPASVDGRPSLGVGVVEIERRALAPGYRGTTRPQVELIAARGACSVHSQAHKDRGERWFGGFRWRPGEERGFITMINFWRKPIHIDLAYPLGVPEVADLEPVETKFKLPPLGARIHEIALSPAHAERLEDQPFSIRWVSDGSYNTHLICATPDLDRLSIDHS